LGVASVSQSLSYIMPISKQNTQSYAAYKQIKQKVLTGFFSHDDRLREAEVADLVGMSRTPVREALKRLEDERLLTREPRLGLVVTRMSPQDIAELYEMREVLEGAAAAFAAKHAHDAEITHMDQLLQESRKPGCDPVAMNLAFHAAIYSAAHNQHLVRSLQAITDTTYLLGRSTLQTPERAEQAILEHQAILDAITRRDAQAAESAAKRHIRQALVARLAIRTS
jgi:DNA-binding GntR family transcriptional regulator